MVLYSLRTQGEEFTGSITDRVPETALRRAIHARIQQAEDLYPKFEKLKIDFGKLFFLFVKLYYRNIYLGRLGYKETELMTGSIRKLNARKKRGVDALNYQVPNERHSSEKPWRKSTQSSDHSFQAP
jgi:hypothetical protein